MAKIPSNKIATQKGLTSIEVVMVAVVLALIGIVAAPKFMSDSMKTSAQAASASATTNIIINEREMWRADAKMEAMRIDRSARTLPTVARLVELNADRFAMATSGFSSICVRKTPTSKWGMCFPLYDAHGGRASSPDSLVSAAPRAEAIEVDDLGDMAFAETRLVGSGTAFPKMELVATGPGQTPKRAPARDPSAATLTLAQKIKACVEMEPREAREQCIADEAK